MESKQKNPALIAVAIAALLGAAAVGRFTAPRTAAPNEESVAPSHESDVAAAPRDVAVMVLRPGERAQTFEATGTVQASLSADVAPKVMSRVAAIYAREGDAVRRGQTVVRLESADLAAQVQQAQAAVTAARAALAQGQTGAEIQRTQSSTRVAQAQAALAQAREQLSIVKEGARRQQKTQSDEGVNRAEAAKAQADEAVQQAKAALSQAQEQLSLVKEGARKQQKSQSDEGVRRAQFVKAQADEGIAQAQSALAQAREQLSLVKEGARRQQKLQADAALRQAEAQLKTAQATYDRFKPLADEGVISKQRFDEIALQLEMARGAHESAKQQASLVGEGARTQEIRQAEEGVQQAQAAVSAAQARSREAEAGIKQAEAQRDLTYEGARPQEVRQAEEQVRQAQAAVNAAQQRSREAATGVRSAAAQRDLIYEGARPQEVRQAEQQVRQAEEALRMAQAGLGENKIKAENARMLRAGVVQAEANLAAARVNLSYATIVAPFDGVVTKRHLDPGAMATPGAPLLTIVSRSGFRLDAAVPESRVANLRGGDDVTVNLGGRDIMGSIAQIVPAADAQSRTMIVKVALPRVPGLAPGRFGRARFKSGTSQVLSVPQSALWQRESLSGVLVVENGIAHRRLVTVGRIAGGNAELLSGAQIGEEIVARDADAIPDGAAVRVSQRLAEVTP